MDSELLQRIDEDPETRGKGRSAFVRSAIQHYLRAKQRHSIDDQIATAYEGQADALLDEVSDLVEGQAWPSD